MSIVLLVLVVLYYVYCTISIVLLVLRVLYNMFFGGSCEVPQDDLRKTIDPYFLWLARRVNGKDHKRCLAIHSFVGRQREVITE